MTAWRRSAVATVAGAVAAVAVLVPAVVSPITPAGATPPPTASPPKSFIVVDVGTGHVLLAANDHVPYSPASMTKVMTALTVVEHLAPATTVPVTAEAVAKGQSNLTPSGMKVGQRWPLARMLQLLLVISANDAAYSLAAATGGDLAHFAVLETETAHQLGLRDSTFSDPAGLDNAASFRGGPRMSAYDVAITVRNALAVPELRQDASTVDVTYVDPSGAQHHVMNHNKLILADPQHYAGATGFKTGFTNLAGNTLAATATRNGRTLIAIVMNTHDIYGWAARYLDAGFATTPDARGTGETLPPIRVDTYAQRLADRTAFLALAKGSALLTGSATTVSLPYSVTTYHASTSTSAPATSAPRTTTPARAASPGSGSTTGSGSSTSAPGRSHSGGGLITWWRLIVVLAIAAAVTVVLRRRAVSRRRARRLAKRREMQAALRRGSLPVVDGRYRPGMRTGNPVQSHVRIRRDGE